MEFNIWVREERHGRLHEIMSGSPDGIQNVFDALAQELVDDVQHAVSLLRESCEFCSFALGRHTLQLIEHQVNTL